MVFERPRALVVDPDPASCWALRQVLELRGFETQCCLGPTHRTGPCPLLATGSCSLVESAAGPSGTAFIALPADAEFTSDIAREYRQRFGRVILMDGEGQASLADGELLELYRLAQSQVDTMASWMRTFTLGIATAMTGGDPSAPAHAARTVWRAMQVLKQLEPDAAAHPVTEHALLLRDIGLLLARGGESGPSDKADHERAPWHPVRAAEFLRALPGFREAIPIVRHHHERWDGTGYPDRLVAREIPGACRAIAVVEVFEAPAPGEAHEAPSRADPETAIRAVRSERGHRLDPDAVDIFLRIAQDDDVGPGPAD